MLSWLSWSPHYPYHSVFHQNKLAAQLTFHRNSCKLELRQHSPCLTELRPCSIAKTTGLIQRVEAMFIFSCLPLSIFFLNDIENTTNRTSSVHLSLYQVHVQNVQTTFQFFSTKSTWGHFNGPLHKGSFLHFKITRGGKKNRGLPNSDHVPLVIIDFFVRIRKSFLKIIKWQSFFIVTFSLFTLK